MALATRRPSGAVTPWFLLAAALAAGCGGPGEAAPACRLIAGPEVQRQGWLVETDIPTDLALQGSGFFAVRDARAHLAGAYYTRLGQFTIDQDGFLVDLTGRQVLGWQADPSGQLAAGAGPLQLGAATAAPRATAGVLVQGNLQADASILGAFDPANPTTTANFSTSLTVYDGRGGAHQVQVFFGKRANGATGNTWSWSALTDGGDLQGGTPGVLQVIAGGDLAFDTSGRLARATPWASNAATFLPLGASAPQPLTFSFGDPTGEGGLGLLGLTQFASPSASTFVGQDGFGHGQLASVRVDPAGHVEGIFTNGQVRVLAQVGVATFLAPAFLAPFPGHLFAPSVASGAPQLGAPGTGLRGSIVSGALEQLGEEPGACLSQRP